VEGREVTVAEFVFEVPVEKWEAFVLVSEEARQDRAVFVEHLRLLDLWFRGFLGLIRCARCHRPTRCLYTVGDRLYGRTCAALV
jgi:hypothetical protein